MCLAKYKIDQRCWLFGIKCKHVFINNESVKIQTIAMMTIDLNIKYKGYYKIPYVEFSGHALHFYNSPHHRACANETTKLLHKKYLQISIS